MTAEAFVSLAFGRDREAQFTQLFSQLVIAQTRRFHCAEQRCLAFPGFGKKRPLSRRITIQLRESFRGAVHLLRKGRSFPFQRVHFSIRFMQLALEGAGLQGDVGMVGPRRLMLFADLFEVIDCSVNLAIDVVAAFAEIISFFEKLAVFSRERGNLRFSSEKRVALLVDGPAINNAFGGNEIAGRGDEGEAREFLPEFQRLLQVRNKRDLA